MDFIEYTNTWAKSEVMQGRIMIGLGILLLLAFYGILRSQNELMRGMLLPLSLLLVTLIGYGGYILYSRPAHAKASIALYKQAREVAIEKEKEKHIKDNKVGNTLIKYVYPSLLLISALILLIVPSIYYKGMALGFSMLFVATYLIDHGFVSRSNAFLTFLNTIQ